MTTIRTRTDLTARDIRRLERHAFAVSAKKPPPLRPRISLQSGLIE